MPTLELLERAKRDLRDIQDFSTVDFGWPATERYMESFEEAFDLLLRYPEAGAVIRKLTRPLRRYSCNSHRIFYRVRPGGITIVRVLHHARNEAWFLR